MNKVHQIYGKSAIRTACGLSTNEEIQTAYPGKGVTCKTCIKVENARKKEPKVPNKLTLEAMRQLDSGKGNHSNTVEEFFKETKIWE